ncbi:MAG: hypothetical protein GWO24_21585 [Akkermansiaceae bacterium]|nr:hypothetical protein [Akkermansiaceae bacterium]
MTNKNLAPRPLRFEALVDGLNRPLDPGAVLTVYQPALDSYHRAGAGNHLMIGGDSPIADWLLGR